MDADRTLVVFGKIEDLMNWLFELDLGRQTIRQLKRVGFDQSQTTLSIRPSQLRQNSGRVSNSDRNGHPAFLIRVVMDPRDLAFFPANRHHFKPVILVNKIARIKIRAPMEIFDDRIDIDGVVRSETDKHCRR